MGSSKDSKQVPPADLKDTASNEFEIGWKGETTKEPVVVAGAKKKRPVKPREIPEYYFLPRRSWPNAILVYGAAIVGGIGAGMLVEVWMKKRMEEGGSDPVIWVIK